MSILHPIPSHPIPPEEVKAILECECVDINERDSSGQYPLEMVLIMENCQMAKLLLGAGADPFVKRQDGQRIYDIAVNSGNKTLRSIFLGYSRYPQPEKTDQ
ncbi:ankyrin repeat domain-containing protein [Sansalvadorimonas sp. 2012CJ34-2]|uniref:Ankyrin repeat domain-containing protein n=1 Tax=Parendozoicomonas callyspongiae TaxID=2942213 RepID=A0ABT0PCU4_9GAMM|nr:ankyrin repeat domain-containing protein [Sansalvadorimonas sp. 2012CJ34-2]MCL6269190.1 ankyrin repeat domain-containing protein [Sansalvadorimonas sp. 2012CJ34-2]